MASSVDEMETDALSSSPEASAADEGPNDGGGGGSESSPSDESSSSGDDSDDSDAEKNEGKTVDVGQVESQIASVQAEAGFYSLSSVLFCFFCLIILIALHFLCVVF